MQNVPDSASVSRSEKKDAAPTIPKKESNSLCESPLAEKPKRKRAKAYALEQSESKSESSDEGKDAGAEASRGEALRGRGVELLRCRGVELLRGPREGSEEKVVSSSKSELPFSPTKMRVKHSYPIALDAKLLSLSEDSKAFNRLGVTYEKTQIGLRKRLIALQSLRLEEREWLKTFAEKQPKLAEKVQSTITRESRNSQLNFFAIYVNAEEVVQLKRLNVCQKKDSQFQKYFRQKLDDLCK